MWWETVGWLSPTGSVMSQTHAPSSDAAAIIERSLTRVGSASALNIRARVSAASSPTMPAVTGEQQEARSADWITGRLEGMKPFWLIH